MDYIKRTAQEITKHALAVISQIDKGQKDLMIETIINSESTFIVGSGRSELIGKAFAMRLMHLGFTVTWWVM